MHGRARKTLKKQKVKEIHKYLGTAGTDERNTRCGDTLIEPIATPNNQLQKKTHTSKQQKRKKCMR